MREVSVLGIDLAKSVFHMVGMDRRGKVVVRKRLYRTKLLSFVSSLDDGVLIAMESCASSNYWGREFLNLGKEVRLIAPQFVKPYVKSNKNDMADAEAIAEAALRPTMRFVPVKSVEQQDIQSLHRARERLVKSRTALVNEIRGLLGEYGITLPQSVPKFRKNFIERLSAAGESLTSLSRETFNALYEELSDIETRVAFYDKKLQEVAKNHPECKRLQSIPGVGPLSATAIIASVGDMSCFENGRQFAASLGLVPRQSSTGGKSRLLGISKRGDGYIRKLLVHGARSSLRWLSGKTDRLSIWASAVKERRGANKAAVALANKNARIIWAVLTREEQYQVFEPVTS
jgi:transposase